MNNSINFNGSLIDPQTRLATVFNRSLRFGDGLFETMFWDGHLILNINYHLDRLFGGLGILHYELPEEFTRKFISKEIKKLAEHNAKTEKARVRLTVFREDGATLMPVKNKPLFIIESGLLAHDSHPLNLTIFKNEYKSTGQLSNLKTNNYLLYLLALQYARENKFDDAILLNSRNNICEASSSNIFIIQNEKIYTPPLTEGCVAGTKRRELLEILSSHGFEVEEKILTTEELLNADEVFLTNAVRGIRPVARIDEKTYGRETTGRLVGLLNRFLE